MSDPSNEGNTNDPGHDQILAYLREHSRRYRLDFLRQELVKKGYDAASVDRAIQIFQGEARPRRGMPTWQMACLIIIGMAVLLVGICIVFVGGLGGH